MLGSYSAPDFRGGVKNKKFACIISSKTEESTNPSISIQAVALTCTHALQHKRPLTMAGHDWAFRECSLGLENLLNPGQSGEGEEGVLLASSLLQSALLNLDRLQVFPHCGSHLPTSTSLGSKEVLVRVCITAIFLEKT